MIKQKDISSLIKHDIYEGIIQRWKYYTMAIAFFIMVNTAFVIHAQAFLSAEKSTEQLGINDLLINVMRGNFPFDPSLQKGIDLPIVWFAYHALLSLLIGFYIYDDLKGSASSVILRVHSKTKWWTSKIIWCVFSVCLYYILFLATCIIFILGFGNISAGSPYVCKMFFDISISHIENLELFFISWGLPLIISISISIFQITISLIIKPLYSFFVIVCYLVISSFYCNQALIFNFAMVIRNSAFYSNSGITASAGITIALFVTILSCFAGSFFVKRKDIL